MMNNPFSPAQDPALTSLSLDRLCEILRPYWPEAEILLFRVQSNPAQQEYVRRILIMKCLSLGLDPEDPFHPHPEQTNLWQEGLPVGRVLPTANEFYFGLDELSTGALLLGSPRSGKTVAVCHLIREAQKRGIGVFCPDLRGDYLRIAPRIPKALLVPVSKERFNPFEPPPGVELKRWLHVVAGRLTLDLGLQLASQAYVISLLDQLLNTHLSNSSTYPTLLDFYDLLLKQKPRSRSSQEGYWERVLARIWTLIDVCGRDVFAVQKGFPILEALEDGRLVILDLKVEKFVADFLVSMYLYRLYYHRLHSPAPFDQKPILIILDEQRSLIRLQSHEFGIPDIELLFSRARALGLGFMIAEQVPSAVSPAVLTSCRLRLAFNTSPPEQIVAARLLGLNPEQAEELYKLPVGQCIARLSGDRIPVPFRLEIPYPEFLR